MISKKANTQSPPFTFAFILSLNILTISSPPQIRALTPSAEGLGPSNGKRISLLYLHTHNRCVRGEAAEDCILEYGYVTNTEKMIRMIPGETNN